MVRNPKKSDAAKKKKKQVKYVGQRFRKYIQYDNPEITGLYLTYINLTENCKDPFPVAYTTVQKYDADRKIWSMGNLVLGWIGPIPQMTLDELNFEDTRKAEVNSSEFYFVGNSKGIHDKKYQNIVECTRIAFSVTQKGKYIFRQRGKRIRVEFQWTPQGWKTLSQRKAIKINQKVKEYAKK